MHTPLIEWISNLIISMATGAYTGWVVTRYYYFHEQITGAIREVMKLHKTLIVISQSTEKVAAYDSSQVFIDYVTNLVRMGFRSSGSYLMQTGSDLQRGLMDARGRLDLLKSKPSPDGVKIFVASLNDMQIKVLKDLERVPMSMIVLLFGDRAGLLHHEISKRYKRLCEYLETGTAAS